MHFGNLYCFSVAWLLRHLLVRFRACAKGDARVRRFQRELRGGAAFRNNINGATMYSRFRSVFRAVALLILSVPTSLHAQHNAGDVPFISSGLLSGDQTAISLDQLLSVRVSTASLYSQLAREAPASVSIIGADEIARYQFRTIAELLSFVRSFYVSYDRNYDYVGVRGYGRPSDYNNRILLLWNGHELNDNVYLSAALGNDFTQDLNSIERVEVVRGPGSPLYGANAMLAVINIIGKTGADVNGAEAAMEYGSTGFARGSLMYGGRTESGVDGVLSGTWLYGRGADLYYPEFDAPETNNGIVRHADREKGFGVNGRLSFGDLTISGIVSSREKWIPTAAYGTVFGDTRARTRDRRWGVMVEYTGELTPALRLSGQAAFDGYEYDGVYPYEYLQFDGSRGRCWTGGLHAQWDTDPSNRLDVGLEVRANPRADYHVWSEEGYDYYRNAGYSVASAFLQDTYQMFPDVSLSLALRADHHSLSGWLMSPRFSVVANPSSRNTIKFLYGEAFRAPSFYEVYYDDGTALVGTPDLKSERVRTIEISAEHRISSILYGSVSLYQFNMRDLIEQTTAQGETVGQHQNIGSARARGIECELIIRTPAGHTASLSFGTQYSEGVGSQPELTNSPRTIVGVSSSVKILEDLELAVRARYETGRLTITGSRTDPFLLVNAYLHLYRIGERSDLSLAVRNVFDSRYAYPGGLEHTQPWLMQDGRTFDLRAVVRW